MKPELPQAPRSALNQSSSGDRHTSGSAVQPDADPLRDPLDHLTVTQAPEAIELWRTVELAVTRLSDNRGMAVDHRIRPLVVALNALGFPTISSCEGHVDRTPFNPFVKIGVPPPAFERRFDEQTDRLNAHLRMIPLPLPLRAKLFSVVGWGPLTATSCQTLNIPETFKNYPEIVEQIAEAFRASAADIRDSTSAALTPVPTEQLREAQNTILLQRLDHLVSRFMSDHTMPDDTGITVDYSHDFVIELLFTPLPDLGEQSYAQLKSRQQVVASLAEFLAIHYFETFPRRASISQLYDSDKKADLNESECDQEKS